MLLPIIVSMDMAIAMISPRVGLFDMAFSILATDLLTRILENKPRNAASGVRDRLVSRP